MAHEEDTIEQERASWTPSPGLAVAVPDPVQPPALPPHRERMTDKDPVAMKHAVRTVYTLFYFSVAASIWAIAAYFLFPIESGAIVDIRNNNTFVGLGIGLALLAIGIAAIHWAKAIMSNKEYTEARHPTRGRDSTRAAAIKAFADANEESGFGRRAMVRNSLIAAVVASVAPAIVLFRGLAPQSSAANPIAGDPVALLSHTMWEQGMRLAHDPEGGPIRAADITLGSAVHVIPEPLAELSHEEGSQSTPDPHGYRCRGVRELRRRAQGVSERMVGGRQATGEGARSGQVDHRAGDIGDPQAVQRHSLRRSPDMHVQPP
ncbi:MAG: hypothetical protein ACXWZG_03245 [Microbacterium sp.]